MKSLTHIILPVWLAISAVSAQAQPAGPWGVSISRNITADREKGIGKWTDAEIKRAISVRNDGTPLKPAMSYAWYARVTKSDLDAVVAYLRTLPR